jgi:uncharacterized LabA/DUF88 family protein
MPPAVFLSFVRARRRIAIMMKRCCVFVDGENLRHGIVNLFQPEFDRKDYLPKDARWDELFFQIAKRACHGSELLRTYWYTIQHLDFYPYRISNDKRKRNSFLQRQETLSSRLKGLSAAEREAECDRIASELMERRQMMQDRFDGWISIQNGISQKHRSIEFRRAGTITHNLLTNRFGNEKAVDVKLATDLIVLRDIYDVAVIVSGDQDYVPAVQVVKDAGKTVVNVAFERRDGQLHPGGARRLNQLTDYSVRVKHDDPRDYLGIGKRENA